MTERSGSDRLGRLTLIAGAVAVALLVLPYLVVVAGGPPSLVGALSTLSQLAVLVALVLTIIACARRVRWALVVAAAAMSANAAAALVLMIHEPGPAYLHPEWDWYWPVANSLYFGGLALTLVAVTGSLLRLSRSRERLAWLAVGISAVAVIVNRIAPYR